MRKILPLVLLTLILVPSVIAQPKKKSSIFKEIQTLTRRPESEFSAEAVNAKVVRDVTYCRPGSTALKMDIYVPQNRDARPAPALLYIHGGAWIGGDKTQGPFLTDLPELLARGYVVFSINYRLAPLNRFPSQLEDCKCAVRSLRANAAQHNIDPTRIGVFGSSAGGHLAALLGLTSGIANFEGSGGYPEQSSAVQAVTTYFGPSDLTTSDWSFIDKLGFFTVFGTKGNWGKASPISYVTALAPPFFIIGGDRDDLVDIAQGKFLYNKLQAKNTISSLLTVKNCGHEFEPDGGALIPTRSNISMHVADFFDHYLRVNATQANALPTTRAREVTTRSALVQ